MVSVESALRDSSEYLMRSARNPRWKNGRKGVDDLEEEPLDSRVRLSKYPYGRGL